MAPTRRRRPKVAFVLGGGGNLGAYEVGMLRALLERGIRPDVVLGTSVGALNGAAVAAKPDLEMIDRLGTLWRSLADDPVYGGSWFSAAATLVRSKVALHSNAPLRELIRSTLPVRRFEELAVPFQCVAACIERAAEHWFDTGDLIPAILASTAVPGLLPPVKVGREHFMDGGLVNSIPLERAFQLGATEVYVLHVGRIERPLTPPKNLLQATLVAFEIARRNRFARDLEARPAGVDVHVLPTGGGSASTDRSPLRYRDATDAAAQMEGAHRAASRYLARHTQG
jgi:NTE family protein